MFFAKYLSAYVEMKPGYIQSMRNLLLMYPRVIGREVENCDNTLTEVVDGGRSHFPASSGGGSSVGGVFYRPK
jgi:hypothetical protein